MDNQRRDRSGEIFQNDLTTNETATPPAREEASHDLQPDPNVDSAEADRNSEQFARELRKTGHEGGR